MEDEDDEGRKLSSTEHNDILQMGNLTDKVTYSQPPEITYSCH
jgi:hypothetical protein